MPLCPIKWRPLKFFAKFQKSPLLMTNIVKYAGRFLAYGIPWKIMKNTFYFNLTNWIFFWQIRFWTYYEFLLNQMSDIRQVWKYLPLKNGFCWISQKFYGRWTKRRQTFSRHFFWEQPSKYCIAEFTTIFVCMLLSWSRRYSMKWSSNFDDP